MIYASRCGCHQSSSDKCPCLSLVGHDFFSFAKYPSRLAVTWRRWQAQLIWWKVVLILLTPHSLSPMHFSRGALELESVYLSIWKFQAVTPMLCCGLSVCYRSEPPQRCRTGSLSKSLAELSAFALSLLPWGAGRCCSLGGGGCITKFSMGGARLLGKVTWWNLHFYLLWILSRRR